MIPQKLTIEGLYSYQERQTIDFTSLMSAGLFGIFGATGSGKSSILEAITFALYGKTERLSLGDNRNYNMLNLKSDRMYIEFDFYNYDNQHYRAVRELKRNSKKFDTVNIPSNHVIFYKIENDVILPLENVDAEKLIGMTYDNFKRTIIIPQGQFKEFLELKPTARTEMLKEIFNLYRFDLQDRVALLISENKSKFDRLEGQIAGYEDISEENITLAATQLTEESKVLEQLQSSHKDLDEKYQRAKQLMSEFELLNNKKEKFKLLIEQQSEIQQLEAKVAEFERVKNYFDGLFRELDKNTNELKTKTAEQSLLVEAYQKLEKDQKELEIQLKDIVTYHDSLPQKRLAENDLELIAAICTLNSEVEALKFRKAKGKEKVEEVTDKTTKITAKIKQAEEALQQLKTQKVAVEMMLQIDAWYVKSEGLLETIKNQNEKINKVKVEIKSITDKLIDKQIDKSTFNEVYKVKFSNFESQKEQLEKQKSALEVHQKLTDYAHELHDGASCPLCGSLEHPHPIEQTDASEELKQVSIAIQAIEVQKLELQKEQSEIERLIDHYGILEKSILEEQAQLTNLNEKWTLHQSEFVWKEFDKEDKASFLETKKRSFETIQQIEVKEKEITEWRKSLEAAQANLVKYKELLDEINLLENTYITNIQSNKQKIKTLNFSDYDVFTIDEVKQQYDELKLKNDKNEQQFKGLTKSHQEINIQLSSQKATLVGFEKRIGELTSEMKILQQKIAENIIKAKVENVETARKILAQEIDIKRENDKISNFKIEFETLKNSIKESEEKLKSVSFDMEQFRLEEEKWKQSFAFVEEKSTQIIRLQADLDRLKQAFESKKSLLIEKALIEKRADNLKIMASLFYRAGFVQFASSVYLGQLCDIANVRFHRLTRNQLSLQMNENNEFEVIDYLNEGRTRSVKTLSGGQSFQVSLSLALALAESVQSNAKSDRNFFFIDEGFGTQDEASINIIFETLLHLNKEHKIVGIISHVDELKERIPASLVIEKDNERGSLVRVNQ